MLPADAQYPTASGLSETSTPRDVRQPEACGSPQAVAHPLHPPGDATHSDHEVRTMPSETETGKMDLPLRTAELMDTLL